MNTLRIRVWRSCVIVFASALGATGCGPADALFTTKLASNFAPAHRTVSVLGVYKDGQMSSDAWETIRARISPSLGGSACGAAYTTALLSTDGLLASAIDDYARSSGPTDELLVQLAPASRGDLIVVFTWAGQLPSPKVKNAATSSSSISQPGGGGARGGMRRGSRRGSDAPTVDSNELDISASFFSVSQKQSVGLVAMQYVGASVDDAITKFATELGRTLPNARCAEWDWKTSVDAERIRQSIQP